MRNKNHIWWGRALGDKPKWTNTNLRFAAAFCGFLRKSAENRQFAAKICVSQMLAVFSRKGERQPRICENLCVGSVCPLRFIPLSAPTPTFVNVVFRICFLQALPLVLLALPVLHAAFPNRGMQLKCLLEPGRHKHCTKLSDGQAQHTSSRKFGQKLSHHMM